MYAPPGVDGGKSLGWMLVEGGDSGILVNAMAGMLEQLWREGQEGTIPREMEAEEDTSYLVWKLAELFFQQYAHINASGKNWDPKDIAIQL